MATKTSTKKTAATPVKKVAKNSTAVVKTAQPKLIEVPMRVTIPTGQYANIQPEVTGIGETFEAAQVDALRKAASFYDSVEAQAGLTLKLPPSDIQVALAPDKQPVGTTLKCYLSGTEVFFDPAEHAYVDSKGNKYLSGSTFAKQYEWEFPKELILPNYAKRYDVKEYEVEEMWAGKADASTTFGTALHQALETYIRYYDMAKKVNKDPINMIHPLFRKPVLEFCTPERMANEMVTEMFVADPYKFRCGQLDLVTIVDREKKIMDIEDYKTNADLFTVTDTKHKNLKPPFQHLPNMNAAKYTLQLSFYKAIARTHGWTVRNLNLHHYGGGDGVTAEQLKWVTTTLRHEDIDREPIKVSDYL